MSLFIAALLSTAIASAALRGRRDDLLTRRELSRLLLGAFPVAILAVVAAPLLPPVPADCLDKGAGTKVEGRELTGRADSFPAGTPRVYAWFAVALPSRYQQEIVFRWSHDGKEIGGPVTTTITGGRANGWRTATSRNNPAPGRWRADVLNEANQLIGRVKFDVTP